MKGFNDGWNRMSTSWIPATFIFTLNIRVRELFGNLATS